MPRHAEKTQDCGEYVCVWSGCSCAVYAGLLGGALFVNKCADLRDAKICGVVCGWCCGAVFNESSRVRFEGADEEVYGLEIYIFKVVSLKSFIVTCEC
jgi:hypothetical protein